MRPDLIATDRTEALALADEIEPVARAICERQCLRTIDFGTLCLGADGYQGPCKATRDQLLRSWRWAAARDAIAALRSRNPAPTPVPDESEGYWKRQAERCAADNVALSKLRDKAESERDHAYAAVAHGTWAFAEPTTGEAVKRWMGEYADVIERASVRQRPVSLLKVIADDMRAGTARFVGPEEAP